MIVPRNELTKFVRSQYSDVCSFRVVSSGEANEVNYMLGGLYFACFHCFLTRNVQDSQDSQDSRFFYSNCGFEVPVTEKWRGLLKMDMYSFLSVDDDFNTLRAAGFYTLEAWVPEYVGESVMAISTHLPANLFFVDFNPDTASDGLDEVPFGQLADDGDYDGSSRVGDSSLCS